MISFEILAPIPTCAYSLSGRKVHNILPTTIGNKQIKEPIITVFLLLINNPSLKSNTISLYLIKIDTSRF